jgi:hypothetical protein
VVTDLPGSNRSDDFTITPEQRQAHEAAAVIVRRQVEARGFGELVAMRGLAL